MSLEIDESARTTGVARPRLYLSQEPGLDRLTALEFGAIDDGQPDERWEPVGEHVGLLHEEPGGRCVGFMLPRASTYDPDDPENAELWEGPRFDVPALGLCDVPPNAIIVATWALYGRGVLTENRRLFSRAIGAGGEAALRAWIRCLQAGDSMAHFAIGYTLYDLGRLPEAYRHLRYYRDIAPDEPWAWCWFGKAAAAIGERTEARAAYATAIELEGEDAEEDERTEALELLEELDEGGEVEVPAVVPVAAGAGTPAVLLEEIRPRAYEGAVQADETSATLLLDTTPVPAWADVSVLRREVRVRAQIGAALWADEEDDEHLGTFIDPAADDIVATDGEVWLLGPTLVLDDVTPRMLEVALLGVAAAAAAYLQRTGERLRLDPPPTYRALVQEG